MLASAVAPPVTAPLSTPPVAPGYCPPAGLWRPGDRPRPGRRRPREESPSRSSSLCLFAHVCTMSVLPSGQGRAPARLCSIYVGYRRVDGCDGNRGICRMWNAMTGTIVSGRIDLGNLGTLRARQTATARCSWRARPRAPADAQTLAAVAAGTNIAIGTPIFRPLWQVFLGHHRLHWYPLLRLHPS